MVVYLLNLKLHEPQKADYYRFFGVANTFFIFFCLPKRKRTVATDRQKKKAPRIKPVFRAKSLWANPLSLPTHKPQTAHTIRGQPPLLDASNFQGDPLKIRVKSR